LCGMMGVAAWLLCSWWYGGTWSLVEEFSALGGGYCGV
jgi:hypothetical protein